MAAVPHTPIHCSMAAKTLARRLGQVASDSGPGLKL
jgi:hypothetical protein